MKNQLLLFLTILFVSNISISQETNLNSMNTFFVQSMFDITNESQLKLLEANLKQNSLVKLFRFEPKSKTFLLITNSTEIMTTEILKSWFGEFSGKFSCIQIGIHGKDKMNSYPIINCNN